MALGEVVVMPDRRQSTMLTLALFTLDVCSIALSGILTSFLHLDVAGLRGAVFLFLLHLPQFCMVFAVWFLVGWSQGMFISHRKDSLSIQWYYTTRAIFITLLISYFLVDFLAEPIKDIPFSITFSVLMYVTVVGYRTTLRLVLWNIRQRGFNLRNVAIVGANHRTSHLLEVIYAHPEFGYNVVGIIEDDPERLKLLEQYHLRHLGTVGDAERILQHEVVDEVHVGLPVRSYYEKIQDMADLCMGVGVSMRIVADLFPLQLATSSLHNFEGIPMLSLTMVSEDVTQLAMKRAVDLTLSVLLLIALAPLLLTVAIIIKVTSPGPVFFLQQRVGLNQRKFNMIKFRSMVEDAEQQRSALEELNEADGPIFKLRNDPRVTRIGRFIRKYSIDELPQLFNVVRGEMSLVGPRPHPTREVKFYTWHQRRRLSVKPGMTGLAQVSGRSNLSWDECVDLDLTYIDSWSIGMDFWILFRTFRAVFMAHGAC
jgi:exopolysaccharide biosynthesis polyprenyl glycosylphosphotransferase